MLLRRTIALIGLAVPVPHRDEWHREWYAETWYHWFRSSRHQSAWQRVCGIARDLLCCVVDAFALRRAEGSEPELPWWARFGWLGWPLMAAAIGFGTLQSSSPAIVPALFEHLIHEYVIHGDGEHLAVISLKRRLDSARPVIPPSLAAAWNARSSLLTGVAAFSPVRRATVFLEHSHWTVNTIQATGNLFDVLGQRAAPASKERSVVLSYRLWKRLLRESGAVGKSLTLGNGLRCRIAGILPAGFWFFSPAVDLYVLDGERYPDRALLVVNARPDVTGAALEDDLSSLAQAQGTPFLTTEPRALLLGDAEGKPVGFFVIGAALAYLLTLTRSRTLALTDGGLHLHWPAASAWIWQATKYMLVLLSVLVIGLEIFVGARQTLIEPLGGPQLLWFYLVTCGLAFRTLGAGEHFRCRICFRVLERPVAIGSVGPVFLNWSGTELLCPRDHGMLCVPFYRASWQGKSYWIQA